MENSGFVEICKEPDAWLSKLFAETDVRMDKRFAELENEVKELTRSIFGESNGAFAGEFFFSSFAEKKQLVNIQFDTATKNIRFSKKAIRDDFDIVMINDDSVALIEIEYKANAEHLQNLITGKPESFRKLFPEYQGYKFYLGLAGMSFDDENVKKMAWDAGVAILEAQGYHAEIILPTLKAY